jgi:recombination protein RecA
MAKKKKQENDETPDMLTLNAEDRIKASISNLNKVMNTITKHYGKGVAAKGSEVKAFNKTFISTGSFSLDVEIGGGIPEERIAILAGQESSFKTTLAMKTMAEAQRKYPDRMGVWVEWESTFDPDWAVINGILLDKLIIIQPETTEQSMDMIDALIRSKGVHLIVVDSIASMLPSKELEKSMEDDLMGVAGLLNSRFFRKITQALRYNRSLLEENPTKTTVLLINQLRDKVGSYGNPEIMPGGKALRFHASLIIHLKGSDFITKTIAGKERKIGQTVTFRAKKNKVSSPQTDGTFDIYFNNVNGFRPAEIDRLKEVITYGVLWNVISKNHAWYYIDGIEGGFNGGNELLEYLRTDPLTMQNIEKRVMDIARSTAVKDEEEENDQEDSES